MTSNSTQFNRVRASDVNAAFRYAGEALVQDPSDTLLLNEVLASAENEEMQDKAPAELSRLAETVQKLPVSAAIKNRFALAAVAALFAHTPDQAWIMLMTAFDVEPAQLSNLDWARRLAANSNIPDLRHTLEHFAQRAETGDFPADIYMELNDIVYTT
jgi:hypothetical protein